jgi:mycothiol synthase
MRSPRVRAVTSDVIWRDLGADELDSVAALAARCVAADGGLPLVADVLFLRRRFAGEGVRTLVAEAAGTLVAAAAVRPQDHAGVREYRATALVDPSWRGRGQGARLLDWQLGATPDAVTVETEALTPAAEQLFASRGLTCTFAEDVLRFDLARTPVPAIGVPDDVVLRPWDAELAPRFFAVYSAAFADRPGFPGWPLETWVDWIAGDDDFRPLWSLLATENDTDLGFICCADEWLVQVGVLPAARGRRLGAALVCAALDRMRADGATIAYLDVNVDNPAAQLYRRLGFADAGRRARFSGATAAR